MSEEKNQLQSDFLLELFRLCFYDKYTLEATVNQIKSNYLPLQEQRDFFAELKSQAQIENKRPTFGTIKQALRKNVVAIEYIEQIENTDIADSDTILLSLENFIRQAMFVDLYNKSVDLYNKGNKTAAYSLLSSGNKKLEEFSLTRMQFEPVFGGFVKRRAQRAAEIAAGEVTFPFGIDELDHHTGGGPSLGDFVLAMGEAKSSKSMFLIHLDINYARRGYDVCHFQAEGTDTQVKNRIDAAWSGTLYHDLKTGNIEEDELFAKYKRVMENMSGEIFVHTSTNFHGLNMMEVERKIIDLKKKRPNLKIATIDYLDIIPPDDGVYKASDERFKQQRTAEIMKDIGKRMNMLIISVTQTVTISKENAEGDDSEFVYMREHLSENKSKVKPVDFLFSFNRTRDEAKNKMLRIYIDAAREHEGGQIIKIHQNLAQARFYDRKATINAGFFED